MPLPKPEPGLVISYSYLSKWQHAEGSEEGDKNRPCVVVVAAQAAGEETVVTVVPMTTQAPGPGRRGIAVPPRVGRYLGLAESPSWVMVDEVNRFVWPGTDLRQIPDRPGRFDYGFVPPRLFAAIKATILNLYRTRRLGSVTRST